jgi:hypothetical protein
VTDCSDQPVQLDKPTAKELRDASIWFDKHLDKLDEPPAATILDEQPLQPLDLTEPLQRGLKFDLSSKIHPAAHP